MKDVMLDLEEVQKEKMDLQERIDDVSEVNVTFKRRFTRLRDLG